MTKKYRILYANRVSANMRISKKCNTHIIRIYAHKNRLIAHMIRICEKCKEILYVTYILFYHCISVSRFILQLTKISTWHSQTSAFLYMQSFNYFRIILPLYNWTNVPIGAWKCSSLKEIMTDRPTKQTDMRGRRSEVTLPITKVYMYTCTHNLE